MLSGTQPVGHGNGRIFEVIVCAVKRVIGIKISFVIDYVADAAGHRPIIVSEIHDCRTCVGNQIDVVGRRVRLIEDVGNIRLQIKPSERVPCD